MSATALRLDDATLPDYLRELGLLGASESARVEPAGDGNINWVRRVRHLGGSFVVKQARPALERFPEYTAPTERIEVEARYYERVVPLDADGVTPRVLAFDAEHKVLLLEDLGDARRLDAALAEDADLAAPARVIARFLGTVHAATRDEPGLAERFANAGMQRLHGEHVFRLPFHGDGFPLDPPLAERAAALRGDAALVARIDSAFARFLEPRGCLVHGDVQATNILLSRSGPRLIDAEIAHSGDGAFDVGQLFAHLALPLAARGALASAEPLLSATWDAYREAHGAAGLAALESVACYAGIEMLRRTLGAARVPAVAEPGAALAVLEAGVRLVRRGFGS